MGVPISAQPSTFHIALAFRVVRRGIELHIGELDDLRIDIETLRTMINTALDNGGDGVGIAVTNDAAVEGLN